MSKLTFPKRCGCLVFAVCAASSTSLQSDSVHFGVVDFVQEAVQEDIKPPVQENSPNPDPTPAPAPTPTPSSPPGPTPTPPSGTDIVMVPGVSTPDFLDLFRDPARWPEARSVVTHLGYSEVQGVGTDSGLINCNGVGPQASYVDCRGNDYESLTAPDADMFGKMQTWGKKVSIMAKPTYPGEENCAYSSAGSVEFAKALIRNAVQHSVREEDIEINFGQVYEESLDDRVCASYASFRDAMAHLVVSIKSVYPGVKVRFSEAYQGREYGRRPTILTGSFLVTRYKTVICGEFPFLRRVYVYDPPLDDPCNGLPPFDGRPRVVHLQENVPGLLDYHADLRRRIEELKREQGLAGSWNADGMIIDLDWETLVDVETLNPSNDREIIRDLNRIIQFGRDNRMSVHFYLTSDLGDRSVPKGRPRRDMRLVSMRNYNSRDFYETLMNKIDWIYRAQHLSGLERLEYFGGYYFTSWATRDSFIGRPYRVTVPRNLSSSEGGDEDDEGNDNDDEGEENRSLTGLILQGKTKLNQP